MKKTEKNIKSLPQKPGVYIFKDKTGRILYVGKAINLRNRVRSHFAKKIDAFRTDLIEKIADIDWIETDGEKQAFLLENELIKKYKPRYNIQWRDDKSYFWVAFSDDKWPRLKVVHRKQIQTDQDLSVNPIGPFVNGRELKAVLRNLRKVIPFRTCKNPFNKPCLQWHLGLCPAHGYTFEVKLRKNYSRNLNALSQFLKLYAGEAIRIEAYDISNMHGIWATGSMIVFYGGKPSKDNYRRFKIKTIQGANDVAMIQEVLKRRFGHPEWQYPGLILIDGGIAQLRAAKRIIKRLSPDLFLVALAKREEELYTEFSSKTLPLRVLPTEMRLIFQAIRNEAHRFAIFYYRHLHGKQYRTRKVAKNSRAAKSAAA